MTKTHLIALILVLLFSAQVKAEYPNTRAAGVYFLGDGELAEFDGNAVKLLQPHADAALAKGKYHYLFDWKETPAAKRFLLSKEHDNRFRSDSDAPTGVDLWLRDGTGAERQIHHSAYRAKFSPDGQKLAYTTSDCELRLEDLEGRRLHTVRGVYNPSWKRDGGVIVFEKVPAGRNPHLPETLHLAKLDVASGKVDMLTDGHYDDVRPEFHPSGQWILFVSGGRTGFASFWRIAADGSDPEQVTNIGLERIDERFVPTPYQKTTWSADGRWFLYDFKNGDVRQVWGLEFDQAGKLVRALKLADGLNPQWLEDGKIFAYEKQVGAHSQPTVGRLP